MQEKIKPILNGAAETMLQSFYARAQYSKSKRHKFYDAKAVELVEKIDYDFTVATNDSLMSYGVIARTLVFDELVKEFIDENPTCTVVNIACGLDTRFYRMDNGKITWYNLAMIFDCHGVASAAWFVHQNKGFYLPEYGYSV